MTLSLLDMFCGAGGSSTGAIQIPGIEVRVATNHWQLALDTHGANHPKVDHVCADLCPPRGPRGGQLMDPCPLTAREGPYLLTCCREAGHDGDCWCNNIQTVDQED